MLRYRVTQPDGKRVEHGIPVGLVREFPKEKDQWREVDKLGVGVRINDAPEGRRPTFAELAEFYLKTDCGPDAIRPKSPNTIPITEHIVRDYLSKRWARRVRMASRHLSCSAG